MGPFHLLKQTFCDVVDHDSSFFSMKSITFQKLSLHRISIGWKIKNGYCTTFRWKGPISNIFFSSPGARNYILDKKEGKKGKNSKSHAEYQIGKMLIFAICRWRWWRGCCPRIRGRRRCCWRRRGWGRLLFESHLVLVAMDYGRRLFLCIVVSSVSGHVMDTGPAG